MVVPTYIVEAFEEQQLSSYMAVLQIGDHNKPVD